MKTIEFIRRSAPESVGYKDTVSVYDRTELISRFDGSACPNGFRSTDNAPWKKVYAMVSLGVYRGNVVLKHPKYDKCILLENGGPLPTVNDNIKHDGKRIATEIFIHCGFSDTWRGSMACLTICPVQWESFIRLFVPGEDVTVAITNEERKN